MERRPQYIVMHAQDTFSPLFWDDEDCDMEKSEYAVTSLKLNEMPKTN